MKRLFGALIGLGLVLLPNVAMAENWQVAANNSESAVHIDLDSVKFVKGYRSYELISETRTKTLIKGLAVVDCKSYQQVLGGVFLDSGEFKPGVNPKITYLKPGTLGRDAAEKVCAL
jgi:hypothetical protein